MSLRRVLNTALRGLVRASDGSSQAGFSTFPSWLPEKSGGVSRLATPLTHPLVSAATIPAAGRDENSDPPPTEITTLKNGVRIISEATPVGHYRWAVSMVSRAISSDVHACVPRVPQHQWVFTLTLAAFMKLASHQAVLLFWNASPSNPHSIALHHGSRLRCGVELRMISQIIDRCRWARSPPYLIDG